MNINLILLILTLLNSIHKIPITTALVLVKESKIYSSESLNKSESSSVKFLKEILKTTKPKREFPHPENNHPPVKQTSTKRQSSPEKKYSRYAYASLRSSIEQSTLPRRDSNDYEIEDNNDDNSQILLRSIPFKYSNNCPIERKVKDCESEDSARKYRRADGTCNNFKNPTWGSSFQPYTRYLPQEYDDGVSSIRKSVNGIELPSPRTIAAQIYKRISRTSSMHTLMLMQWGEFLDHDLILTAQPSSFNDSNLKCCNKESSNHPDCLPISIPPDDPYYNGTETCMEFIRSSPGLHLDCGLGPREQLNQLTPWLDGSFIYGSTEKDLRRLRLFISGKLRLPNRKLLPTNRNPQDGDCSVTIPRHFCFSSGYTRDAQHSGLAAMYTIWLRQHNLIAEKLALMNPQWSEERMFQETRKIVVAQLQHITFREFLPLVLGPNAVKTFGLRTLKVSYYTGYNESVDGTIQNVFGSAAFRFGHSLVQPSFPRWDTTQGPMPYKVNLSLEQTNSNNLNNFGEIDRISLGLVSTRSQEPNESTTTDTTNHSLDVRKGLDIASVTIQRGRDHGLAPYLKWVEACGLLKPLKHNGRLVTWIDFADATSFSRPKVKILQSLYENPWDIDLFVGGMLEDFVQGGNVGRTFACIIGQTFRNLRKGDRFWYENPDQFTPYQLQAIRNVTLARILCDTGDSIVSIQPLVFLASQLQKNPHAFCSNFEAIPQMNFMAWMNQY